MFVFPVISLQLIWRLSHCDRYFQRVVTGQRTQHLISQQIMLRILYCGCNMNKKHACLLTKGQFHVQETKPLKSPFLRNKTIHLILNEKIKRLIYACLLYSTESWFLMQNDAGKEKDVFWMRGTCVNAFNDFVSNVHIIVLGPALRVKPHISLFWQKSS